MREDFHLQYLRKIIQKSKIQRSVKTLIKLVFILSIIGIFGGYLIYVRSTRPLVVEIASVEFSDLVSSVSASGEIKSENESGLKFSSNGRIIYLPYKSGDKVEKGETLASIDGTQTLKSLENADLDKKKAIDFANEVRETYEGNLNEGPGLYKLKQAEKAIEQADNQIKVLQNALHNLSLFAPFSGTLVEINKKVGEIADLVDPNPIIRLADLESLYFEALLDEEDIGKVRGGQQTRIELDAYPDLTIFGEVYHLEEATSADSAGNKVVKTKIKIEGNPAIPLILGLSGDAEIIQLEKKKVLVAPLEAILKEFGENYVYMLVEDKVKKQPVTPGLENEDFVEVLTGLREEDKLIISDLDKIKPGQQVLVAE